MMPVEAAIIEKLRGSGPCSLGDVVAYLRNFSWGEVFGAVDRLSRNGRVVLLRQPGYSTYQIALRSKFAYLTSAALRVKWKLRRDRTPCGHLSLELEWDEAGHSTGNYICSICGESVAQRHLAA